MAGLKGVFDRFKRVLNVLMWIQWSQSSRDKPGTILPLSRPKELIKESIGPTSKMRSALILDARHVACSVADDAERVHHTMM